jgi:glucans biosynthesis protein
MSLSRRHLLQIAGLAFWASLPANSVWAANDRTATPAPTDLIKPKRKPTAEPFNFDILIDLARTTARKDYKAPEKAENEWLRNLSYDDHRNIRFKQDQAVWSNNKRSDYRLQFFHPGALFTETVEIYEVAGGKADLLGYKPDYFSFDGGLTPPADLADKVDGYAGFRVHTPLNQAGRWDEFLVFLGASYFRAVGRNQNYGLSARGLAVNTATAQGEEFPTFRKFWIERPTRRGDALTIYALLDSRSISGAYRFKVGATDRITMDVSAHLFPRQTIERIGIAPLTSMYLLGENDHRMAEDFRPEVHDSDGLAIHSGTGEWLWRPLLNPATLGVSSFATENPQGFGLLQRDRNFASYEDLEAFYENRPSLWVEPNGDWGKGAVQLVEIPTDSEIHDNIVAYWVPEQPLPVGQASVFDYTLRWGSFPTLTGSLAQVVASRVGTQTGADPHHEGAIKFIVDFKGLAISSSEENGGVDIDLSVSAGSVIRPSLMPNKHIGGTRLAFGVEAKDAKLIELRCTLRKNGEPLSETWCYQWRAG